MTTVLNRKFDLLCHSGTCPSYLIDVLSLLVAHANDTELFKSELRTSGGGGSAAAGSAAEGHASPSRLLPSRGPSAIRPDRAGREASELTAAERRTQLMYRQVDDPDALDDALRASHESVLIAAEQSLQTYAEDLKHMNEIAMATTAKQLRSLRVETQQQMEAFRDRVCAGVVSQTRDELDVMRSEFGAAVKEDASAMVRQLHDTTLSAQHQVQALTTSFAEFVAQTHEATTIAPLADSHEALAAVMYVQEQLDDVAAAAAARSEVDALQERLRELERVVATLGAAMSGSHVNGASTSAAGDLLKAESAQSNGIAAPTAGPPPAPVVAVPILETSSTLANSLSLSNTQRTVPSQPASRPPSRLQSTAKPTSSTPSVSNSNQINAAANGSRGSAAAASPPPQTPPPPPQQKEEQSAPAPATCAARLGVTVESAEEGVVLSDVQPDSVAAQHQLGAGHIISHVGRVAVTTPAAFEAALQASEGQPLKLTTYDPFQGRIRVLTIQPAF